MFRFIERLASLMFELIRIRFEVISAMQAKEHGDDSPEVNDRLTKALEELSNNLGKINQL